MHDALQVGPRRLAAILAADIAGYSALIGADEDGTVRALKAHQSAVLPVVERFGGRVIDTAGDGIMAEFASVLHALNCALTIQATMAERNAHVPSEKRLQYRIGINLGDVIFDEQRIYGDGINIAARLEGLAEPGGICVSGNVHEHSLDKVACNFEDIGEQQLKNIVRPVRAYRVRAEQTAGAVMPREKLSPPGKPSIAVLPFVNMSAERADDYLSDAITENVIIALSRFRDLAVVGGQSISFQKSKDVKIAEMARELSVRFLLRGSIQKSKERVVIGAQLIDGSTCAHVWAERFDRSYSDLFAVLDEVAEQIVGRLGSPYRGRVGKAWRGRADAGSSGKILAYDHFLAGLELFDNWAPEYMPQAREQFLKAIGLDPAFGKAYAKIAFSHTLDAWLGWSDDAAYSLSEAHKYAKLAIMKDDDEAWGYWAMGYYSLFVGQHDRAIACYQRSLELNPNDPDIMNDFGLCLSCSGRSDDAVAAVRRAMRLNPHYPEWWLATVGQVYFDARLYQDAIAALERSHRMEMVANHMYLAASYAALDDIPGAKAAAARARALDPNVMVSSIALGFLNLYKDPKDREHFRMNLSKAEVLEKKDSRRLE